MLLRDSVSVPQIITKASHFWGGCFSLTFVCHGISPPPPPDISEQKCVEGNIAEGVIWWGGGGGGGEHAAVVLRCVNKTEEILKGNTGKISLE